jgi:cell division protein FtsL
MYEIRDLFKVIYYTFGVFGLGLLLYLCIYCKYFHVTRQQERADFNNFIKHKCQTNQNSNYDSNYNNNSSDENSHLIPKNT